MGLSQKMQFFMGIFTTAIVLAAQVSTGSDSSPSPAIVGTMVNAPTPSASQLNEPSSQPPVPIRGAAPALSPINHQEKEPITMNPTYPPATVALPSHLSPQLPPNIQPYIMPGPRISMAGFYGQPLSIFFFLFSFIHL
ncbi:proline-rich receptor-like protein kinase PERK9 [Impatiens glandulifera]|uniref:proline-rich receptor-like protein kinase PERK9 n=1 Tax=Impatiens glandulifera TaxID=253017 RepID=UPI001FB1131A|nr:proline-rich receptor-like protein kinase PERK9 [Impatiens glandulifera]